MAAIRKMRIPFSSAAAEARLPPAFPSRRGPSPGTGPPNPRTRSTPKAMRVTAAKPKRKAAMLGARKREMPGTIS